MLTQRCQNLNLALKVVSNYLLVAISKTAFITLCSFSKPRIYLDSQSNSLLLQLTITIGFLFSLYLKNLSEITCTFHSSNDLYGSFHPPPPASVSRMLWPQHYHMLAGST